MSNSLLHLTTGKAVTGDGSCNLFVFVLPTNENGLATDMFVGKVATKLRESLASNPSVRQHSSPVIAPSVIGMPIDIGGQFASSTVQIADGVILKVSAKHRAGSRSAMNNATLFIRTRASAAARSIKLRPRSIPNVTFNYLEVLGNFDIITADEAVGFGAKVSQINMTLAKHRNTDGLLDIETLAEEEAPPVVGRLVEGSDTPLLEVQRRRIIEEV